MKVKNSLRSFDEHVGYGYNFPFVGIFPDHPVRFKEAHTIMSLQPLAPYLSIIQIILGAALTALVLIQSKGQDLGGFLGGGGGDGGAFRTRRGVEAVLHRLTIIIAVLFFLNAFFAFMAWGQVS
ncbi:MAG: preprotein translocase subunit SecG [Candidatus Promineofilum sp.]|nr:preprotein translocase subunit SecG [Promineifilum sp.]MBP9656737.1 preprotein translocase subunit SecG [Promineifilum sp.]